jgi:hypothetical protein
MALQLLSHSLHILGESGLWTVQLHLGKWNNFVDVSVIYPDVRLLLVKVIFGVESIELAEFFEEKLQAVKHK